MKQTQRKLMTLLWCCIVVTIGLVALFESGIFEQGVLTEMKIPEFWTVMLMELITIGLIPLALRLFKFKQVHDELQGQGATALHKWGVARMLMLTVPMFLNALLYELFFNTTFGYLAIILAICLPFIYPTMNRCLTEIEE